MSQRTSPTRARFHFFVWLNFTFPAAPIFLGPASYSRTISGTLCSSPASFSSQKVRYLFFDLMFSVWPPINRWSFTCSTKFFSAFIGRAGEFLLWKRCWVVRAPACSSSKTLPSGLNWESYWIRRIHLVCRPDSQLRWRVTPLKDGPHLFQNSLSRWSAGFCPWASLLHPRLSAWSGQLVCWRKGLCWLATSLKRPERSKILAGSACWFSASGNWLIRLDLGWGAW